MKKIYLILCVFLISVFLVGCAQKTAESTEATDLSGQATLSKTTCQYTSGCSNIKGVVLTLPQDSGVFLSRGILTYEPNGRFVLVEYKVIDPNDEKKGGTFNQLSEFPLTMCQTKQVQWPVDDCDTCTMNVGLRLVGFKEIAGNQVSKVALVEFITS